LETDLRFAVERREFALVYQPIVALGGGTVPRLRSPVAVEAPHACLLAPGAFIAVLEETG